MKFLCVHGMGTSAAIFESQIAQIRASIPGQHEFVFINGDIETAPVGGKLAIVSSSEVLG